MNHSEKSYYWVFSTDLRLIQNGTGKSAKQLDTAHYVYIAKIVVSASGQGI